MSRSKRKRQGRRRPVAQPAAPVPAAAGSFGARLIRKRSVHLAAIVVLGGLAYTNSLTVPFQWDDKGMIRDNRAVHEVATVFFPPAELPRPMVEALRRRPVPMLSFAVNHSLHGDAVLGYHLVNLGIHIGNALLLYALCLLLLATPALERSRLRAVRPLVALSAAALFVSHPLQTMAVTYIYQRHASLSALFYLASVTLYVASRLDSKRRRLLLGLAVVSAVFAMWSKENAFTLPFVLLGMELLFFRGPVRPRLVRLIVFAPTLVLVPLGLLSAGGADSGALDSIGAAVVVRGDSSSILYFFTQFEALVMYLRLLVLPVGQSIIHDIQETRGFFELDVVLPLVVLLALGAGAVAAIRRSRTGDMLLIGVGVLWFFATIAMESSVIPLRPLAQEYRVYLPSVGLFLALSSLALLAASSVGPRGRAAILVALTIAPLALVGATWARNRVWQTELLLWQDAAAQAPMSAPTRHNLGNRYNEAGMWDDALEEYRAAAVLSPETAKYHGALARVYGKKGMFTEAKAELLIAIREDPGPAGRYYNLGNVYLREREFTKARDSFAAAIERQPGLSKAHAHLGIASLELGQYTEAQAHFETALRQSPELPHVHTNLGRLYLRLNDLVRARAAFHRALELDPHDAQAQKALRSLTPAE